MVLLNYYYTIRILKLFNINIFVYFDTFSKIKKYKYNDRLLLVSNNDKKNTLQSLLCLNFFNIRKLEHQLQDEASWNN